MDFAPIQSHERIAGMTPSPQPKPRSWRRYLRFSVRGLMVLVLLVGCGTGWMVRSAREQAAAVKAIQAEGGRVLYAWQWKDGQMIAGRAPWWPRWFSDHLGVDYLGSVTRVDFSFGCTDEEMVHVGRLRQLDRLEVTGTPAGLVYLERLGRLRDRRLSKGNVTDPGLVHLNGLSRLRWLTLDHTAVSDLGLKHLARLRSLEVLSVQGTPVTNAGGGARTASSHAEALDRSVSLEVLRFRVDRDGGGADLWWFWPSVSSTFFRVVPFLPWLNRFGPWCAAFAVRGSHDPARLPDRQVSFLRNVLGRRDAFENTPATRARTPWVG